MTPLPFIVMYFDHIASASTAAGADPTRKRADDPNGLHLFSRLRSRFPRTLSAPVLRHRRSGVL
jgi:hypothetical protein